MSFSFVQCIGIQLVEDKIKNYVLPQKYNAYGKRIQEGLGINRAGLCYWYCT